MLTSSTQLQKRSLHVIERTRTSSKCQKMKNARAKRAKILFSIVKYANLWGFCCRRGCEELIAFLQIWKPQFLLVVQFPFDNCHSPFSPTTFFEIGVYIDKLQNFLTVLSDERLGAKLRVTENRCVIFNRSTYVYLALLPQH